MSASAIVTIEVECDCPHCGDRLDLMDEDTCPEMEYEVRSVAWHNLNVDATCPSCEKSFSITKLEM